MKIPYEFQLLNRHFTVAWMEDDTHVIAQAKGAASMEQGRVLLYPSVHREDLEHTFLHELVHMIMESAGYPEFSKNEEFVDLISGLLHQYLQTKRGELDD